MFIKALYLPGDGPLTVFAPTNEAIEALPADLVSSLMEDTEMLKQVLLFHVVAGEITSSMADNNIQLPSVAGQPLLVNLYLKSKYYDVSGNRFFFVQNDFTEILFRASSQSMARGWSRQTRRPAMGSSTTLTESCCLPRVIFWLQF